MMGVPLHNGDILFTPIVHEMNNTIALHFSSFTSAPAVPCHA